MTEFNSLGLHNSLLKILEKKNYTNPTPIQENAIPKILAGGDLLGIAQTGTGKTAAFALPILTKLINENIEPVKRGCRAIVLAPTRELCQQIYESFVAYSQGTHMRIVALYGGVAHKPQINALIRGVDVLVATPGRLKDHMDEGNVRLNNTNILVLDEVDQMLDLGFIGAIRALVKKLPENRQNLFFSATMPKEIQRFADELLDNPQRVEVAAVSTAQELVEQSICLVEAGKKRSLVVDLFESKDLSRVMIFTRTKHGADKIAKHMEHFGIRNVIVHGGKNQNQRSKSMELFKAGRVRALVATDVAARGIDIKDVSHVINYDMPVTPESYVHRIGRTARGGKSGHSISICTNQELNLLRAIERLIKQSIPQVDRRNDPTLINDKSVALPDLPEESRSRDRDSRDGRGRSDRGSSRFGSDRGSDRGRSRDRDGERRPARQRDEAREPNFDYSDDFIFNADSSPWELVKQNVPEGIEVVSEMPRRERKPRSEVSNEAPREYTPREKPRSERSFDDKPRGERTFGDRPRGDSSRGERTFGDRPRGDRPRGERSFGDRPRSDSPRGERSFGDRPRSDSPRGERSFGDRPRSDSPRGERSFGDRPRSESPRGDRSFGDRPRSDSPRGERSFGDRPRSDSPRGERSFGDRPRSFGDKPRGDRPFGDRPRSDRPQSDRPRSERPFDRPRGDSAGSEGSRSDRPRGERSFGDKPKRNFDKPRSNSGSFNTRPKRELV